MLNLGILYLTYVICIYWYSLFDVKMTILRTHTHVVLILQICHTRMEEVASVSPIWAGTIQLKYQKLHGWRSFPNLPVPRHQ